MILSLHSSSFVFIPPCLASPCLCLRIENRPHETALDVSLKVLQPPAIPHHVSEVLWGVHEVPKGYLYAHYRSHRLHGVPRRLGRWSGECSRINCTGDKDYFGPFDGWRIFLTNQSLNWIPKKMTHIYMVHPQMNLPSAWPWGIFGCDFFGGLGFYGIKVGWKSSSPPCWWMVWQGVAWAKWRKRVAHKHKANAAVQKACWCVIQRFDSNGNPPRFLTTCMSNHECFVSVFFRQHVLQSFVLGSASRNPCTREW